MLLAEMIEWWEWAVFDENGLCGIRDDAPEDAKKAYEEYKKIKEELRKQHIKI